MTDDVEIKIVTAPNIIGIAMFFAPLVRRGIITDAEGRALVRLRCRQRASGGAPVGHQQGEKR